jgi:hypothetical protein
MLSLQSQTPVLRLVPPPHAGVSEPPLVPAPEILNEMEATIREWLHSDHLDGCDGLRGACWEMLNRINDLLVASLAEASDGVREFLRMVRETGPADDHTEHAFLRMVREDETADDPAERASDDELGWGAREFLRLAEVAEKVTPLPVRP